MIVIYGAWGSGTSAVAGILHNLGYKMGSPFLKLGPNQSRDPITYESASLVKLIHYHVDQQTLTLKTDPGVFVQDIARCAADWGSPRAIKHPALSMFPIEVERAFPRHRKLIVHRDPDATNRTMSRRGWGWWSPGHTERINHQVDQLDGYHLSYEHLIREPLGVIERLLLWLDWIPTEAEIQKAAAHIKQDPNSKIFVQIPSLMDPLLVSTVTDCLDKAANPNQITIGILEQRDSPDAQLGSLIRQHPNQIRLNQIPIEKARGVGLARGMANQLHRGEEWLLQVDAHMLFQPGWDQICLEQWQKCQDPLALLSAYLPGFEIGQTAAINPRAFELVYNNLNHSGIPCFRAGTVINQQHRPVETGYMCGHFLFGKSAHILSVPQDPEIYFTGEEASYAARLWTAGYNIYSPTQSACQHQFYSQQNPRPQHWKLDPNWRIYNRRSFARVLQILGLKNSRIDLGVYGLGSHRSLDQYYQSTGTDYRIKYQEWKSNRDPVLIVKRI